MNEPARPGTATRVEPDATALDPTEVLGPEGDGALLEHLALLWQPLWSRIMQVLLLSTTIAAIAGHFAAGQLFGSEVSWLMQALLLLPAAVLGCWAWRMAGLRDLPSRLRSLQIAPTFTSAAAGLHRATGSGHIEILSNFDALPLLQGLAPLTALFSPLWLSAGLLALLSTPLLVVVTVILGLVDMLLG